MEIVCITLNTRPDKYEYAHKMCAQYDIPATFFIAEKHENGRIGCFESHMEVIRRAYTRKTKVLWVLEDDFFPTPHYSKEAINSILPHMKKIEYCQLGYFPVGPINAVAYFNATKKGNLLRYNGAGAHSYLISRKGMKRVLSCMSNYKDTTHVDLFYFNVFQNGRAACPMLFDQNFSFGTDNYVHDDTLLMQSCRYITQPVFNLKLIYKWTILREWWETHSLPK